MKRVSSPKTQRQQNEDQILRDITRIRNGLSDKVKKMAAETARKSAPGKGKQPDHAESAIEVDRNHILSVISHFTALKRAVKF